MKPIDLKFVIRTAPSEPVLLQGAAGPADYLPEDKAFVLTPDELFRACEGISRELMESGTTVRTLSIVCPPHSQVDFSAVLNAIEPLIIDWSILNIHLAHLDALTFDRIVSKWDQVYLVACESDQGWWERNRSSYACTHLWIENCSVYPDPTAQDGSGTWPELEWITINEGNANVSLARRPADPEPEMWFTPEPRLSRESAYETNTHNLFRVLWGPSVATLSLHNCEDISFVVESEAITFLTDLHLTGSPCTNQVLNWISTGKKLYALDVTQASETEMEWSLLRNLPALTKLDVTSSRFSDQDLIKVLESTRLELLSCYYTELTPESWPTILRSETLKVVWVSTEMLTGKLPEDLPSETRIEAINLLNVGKEHEAYLRSMLERYPGVRTHSM